MAGQVNRGSLFGEKIFQYSSNKNFVNFVEVGTWNGEGSTKCFMDALTARADESCLYSLEANIKFYNQASNYWAPILMGPASAFNKLHLLYGRIIEIEDLVSIEEVKDHTIFSQYPWLEWRDRNISEYEQCSNVLGQLPTEIDVLCLDGGQFSTRAEFDVLKSRTKVVLLDDTTTFKTESIKKEILSQPDVWSVILDLPLERSGMMIASKSEYLHLL
tara:strand:+ start:4332 stop:4982 length:651 start_codon:yes stop_codon:yes gene_type:complete